MRKSHWMLCLSCRFPQQRVSVRSMAQARLGVNAVNSLVGSDIQVLSFLSFSLCLSFFFSYDSFLSLFYSPLKNFRRRLRPSWSKPSEIKTEQYITSRNYFFTPLFAFFFHLKIYEQSLRIKELESKLKERDVKIDSISARNALTMRKKSVWIVTAVQIFLFFFFSF
jgi:hypothetical protein